MSALAFSFTKLVVSDLDAVESFYCNVFGMKALHRVTSAEHAYPLEEVILSLTGEAGDHRLVVTRYLERPSPPPGSVWTGFVVTDMAATLAAVEAAGGSIEVPVHENAEHGVLAAIAADPEGHLIKIIQMLGTG